MTRLLKVTGVAIAIIFSLSALHADGCEFWFSFSDTDPTPVTQATVSIGDTLVLYAWISADQPTWDWIGAINYPIVFDTAYLQIIDAAHNEDLGPSGTPDSLYMFAGVNWPGMGEPHADTLETQLLWYYAVCYSQCLSSDGTPYYIGYVRFVVKNAPSTATAVIDTMTYPPSNSPLLIDNSGWNECVPQWTPFSIIKSGGGGEVLYTRGDANASGGPPNVVDASYLLANLMPVPHLPCLRSGDADANQNVNIVDASYILGHIMPYPSFPPPNWPDSCGNIPTDTLPCDSFPPCSGKENKIKKTDRVKLSFGDFRKLGEGLYAIPVVLENEVGIAGFQFKVGFNSAELEVVRISDENCATEDFDYFNTYVGDGEAFAVGLAALQPYIDGVSPYYLEPGKHVIAELIVKPKMGKIRFDMLEAIFADLRANELWPASLMSFEERTDLPMTFALSQNVPNPFREKTLINYALPRDAFVEITLFNAAGQKVRTLVRGHQSAGYRKAVWDGTDDNGRKVSPGVYFCKMEAANFSAIKKLILIE